MFGEAPLEFGLERAVVLHAIGEGVADDGDVVAGLQLEPGRGVVGGRYLRRPVRKNAAALREANARAHQV